MLIDVTKELLDFEGEPLPLQTAAGSPPKDMTVRNLATTVLTASFRDEQVDAESALDRFELAREINKARKTIELTTEEISSLIDLVSKSFSPMVLGRFVEFMDPARLKRTKKDKQPDA